MATKEEKEIAAKAKLEAEEAARIKKADEDEEREKSPEELQAESDRIEALRAQKEAEKKAAHDAAQGTESQNQMYSKAEVLAFIKQAVAESRQKEESGAQDLDDEDPYKQKKVRLPRFNNKFIFGFENTNTDEYFPDLVVQAFDIWNDMTKRNDAWVKVIFEDDTRLSVPLNTVITKSQKVWVDLVEVIEEDKSYANGRVERAEVKDYSRSGTGTFMKAKVTMADYKYKIKLPNSNKEVIVGKEVINW